MRLVAFDPDQQGEVGQRREDRIVGIVRVHDFADRPAAVTDKIRIAVKLHGARGKTVGVVKDTMAANVLAESVDDADFQFFDTPDQALAAVKDGSVEILGGDSLWLRANQAATAPDSSLVPDRPYARSGVGCVVADTTPHLLNISNLGIGRLLSGYINDDDGVRPAINAWIGTDSSVGLKDEQINRFFTIVLSTAAQFNPQS